MPDFSAEVLALRRILGQRKTYRETIFRIIAMEKIAPSSVKELKRNVFAVLRRYFSLSFEVDSLFPSLPKDEDERYLALVALYQLRYRKDVEREQIKSCYYSTHFAMRLSGDCDVSYSKIEQASMKPFAIPEGLKKKPYTYNSLALEIPDFLLRDLVFSYGPEKAREIALSLREMPHATLVENRFLSDGGRIEGARRIDTDKGNIYLLESGREEKEMDAIKKGYFHPLELVKAMALSLLPDFFVEMDCLLLNQRLPYLSCALASRYKDLPGLRVTPVFEKEERYRSAIDTICALKANGKVHPLLCENDLVKTYFPYDSMDVVVQQGSDIGIGKIGMRPDILPDLTEKDVRDSCYRQTQELVAASGFVRKDGYLLFINSGLTMNETRNVREAFLSLRKNYEVVSDSYLLPGHYRTEGGYYCLFRRIK